MHCSSQATNPAKGSKAPPTPREKSSRQRQPTTKASELRAEVAAATERREAVQLKKAQRAAQMNNDNDGNSSGDESSNNDGERTLLFRTGTIKDRALAQRDRDAPLLVDNQRGRALSRFERYNHSSSSHSMSQEDDTSQDSEQFHSGHSHTRTPRRSQSRDPSLCDVKVLKTVDGCPKAADYDEITKAVIFNVIAEYRCNLSALCAFPDNALEAQILGHAWKEACDKSNVSIEITPRIAKLITNRDSQLRGEVKTKVTAPNPEKQKGMYQGKIIQKVINAMWFRNKQDEGIIYSGYFSPMSVPTLALVLTGIECCIDKWITGIHNDIAFTSTLYKDVYEDHIRCLERFDKITKKHAILENILTKLSNKGRFHAGVEPLSTIDIPTIPDSAFEAALRKYEDNTDMETDGENGESD